MTIVFLASFSLALLVATAVPARGRHTRRPGLPVHERRCGDAELPLHCSEGIVAAAPR